MCINVNNMMYPYMGAELYSPSAATIVSPLARASRCSTDRDVSFSSNGQNVPLLESSRVTYVSDTTTSTFNMSSTRTFVAQFDPSNYENVDSMYGIAPQSFSLARRSTMDTDKETSCSEQELSCIQYTPPPTNASCCLWSSFEDTQKSNNLLNVNHKKEEQYSGIRSASSWCQCPSGAQPPADGSALTDQYMLSPSASSPYNYSNPLSIESNLSTSETSRGLQEPGEAATRFSAAQCGYKKHVAGNNIEASERVSTAIPHSKLVPASYNTFDGSCTTLHTSAQHLPSVCCDTACSNKQPVSQSTVIPSERVFSPPALTPAFNCQNASAALAQPAHTASTYVPPGTPFMMMPLYALSSETQQAPQLQCDTFTSSEHPQKVNSLADSALAQTAASSCFLKVGKKQVLSKKPLLGHCAATTSTTTKCLLKELTNMSCAYETEQQGSTPRVLVLKEKQFSSRRSNAIASGSAKMSSRYIKGHGPQATASPLVESPASYSTQTTAATVSTTPIAHDSFNYSSDTSRLNTPCSFSSDDVNSTSTLWCSPSVLATVPSTLKKETSNLSPTAVGCPTTSSAIRCNMSEECMTTLKLATSSISCPFPATFAAAPPPWAFYHNEPRREDINYQATEIHTSEENVTCMNTICTAQTIPPAYVTPELSSVEQHQQQQECLLQNWERSNSFNQREFLETQQDVGGDCTHWASGKPTTEPGGYVKQSTSNISAELSDPYGSTTALCSSNLLNPVSFPNEQLAMSANKNTFVPYETLQSYYQENWNERQCNGATDTDPILPQFMPSAYGSYSTTNCQVEPSAMLCVSSTTAQQQYGSPTCPSTYEKALREANFTEEKVTGTGVTKSSGTVMGVKCEEPTDQMSCKSVNGAALAIDKREAALDELPYAYGNRQFTENAHDSDPTTCTNMNFAPVWSQEKTGVFTQLEAERLSYYEDKEQRDLACTLILCIVLMGLNWILWVTRHVWSIIVHQEPQGIQERQHVALNNLSCSSSSNSAPGNVTALDWNKGTILGDEQQLDNLTDNFSYALPLAHCFGDFNDEAVEPSAAASVVPPSKTATSQSNTKSTAADSINNVWITLIRNWTRSVYAAASLTDASEELDVGTFRSMLEDKRFELLKHLLINCCCCCSSSCSAQLRQQLLIADLEARHHEARTLEYNTVTPTGITLLADLFFNWGPWTLVQCYTSFQTSPNMAITTASPRSCFGMSDFVGLRSAVASFCLLQTDQVNALFTLFHKHQQTFNAGQNQHEAVCFGTIDQPPLTPLQTTLLPLQTASASNQPNYEQLSKTASGEVENEAQSLSNIWRSDMHLDLLMQETPLPYVVVHNTSGFVHMPYTDGTSGTVDSSNQDNNVSAKSTKLGDDWYARTAADHTEYMMTCWNCASTDNRKDGCPKSPTLLQQQENEVSSLWITKRRCTTDENFQVRKRRRQEAEFQQKTFGNTLLDHTADGYNVVIESHQQMASTPQWLALPGTELSSYPVTVPLTSKREEIPQQKQWAYDQPAQRRRKRTGTTTKPASWRSTMLHQSTTERAVSNKWASRQMSPPPFGYYVQPDAEHLPSSPLSYGNNTGNSTVHSGASNIRSDAASSIAAHTETFTAASAMVDDLGSSNVAAGNVGSGAVNASVLRASAAATTLGGVPGVYFDRRKKGFRIRFQNIYVGWVSLSRYASYEEAYTAAKIIWDNAVREATTHQNKQAALHAGIPLQIQSRLHLRNPGGRPRTVSRLPPMVTAGIDAAVDQVKYQQQQQLPCDNVTPSTSLYA